MKLPEARLNPSMTCRCSCTAPRLFRKHLNGLLKTRRDPLCFRPLLRDCNERSYSILRRTPDFAFAFDIDGVLLRSKRPLYGASKTLKYLQSNSIPFILLTNGGGRSEADRVTELNELLETNISEPQLVQSHSPFTQLVDQYGSKNVLVVGGNGDSCRAIAEGYGFKNVIIPADIFAAYEDLWPYVTTIMAPYKSLAKPLPQTASNMHPVIDAIFVFADPRDWAPDIQLIIDLLLSRKGELESRSPRLSNPAFSNNGFQQDGQPPLYFSNGDVLWASLFPFPRLGQGSFRLALEGVWKEITGQDLLRKVWGKPMEVTYRFAEQVLLKEGSRLLGFSEDDYPLKKVYMIGDNPDSDIQGANSWKSERGVQWNGILVKSGVYSPANGPPAHRPVAMADGVEKAVVWALRRENYMRRDEMISEEK